MADLARQPKGKAIPLKTVARRQRVKLKYLEQIFSKLRKAKLITSKKGPGGGYMLGRDPKAIRLDDILRAVGESTAPVLCTENRADKYCSRLRSCPLRACWRELKDIIDRFLHTHTLNDVCRNKEILFRYDIRR